MNENHKEIIEELVKDAKETDSLLKWQMPIHGDEVMAVGVMAGYQRKKGVKLTAAQKSSTQYVVIGRIYRT